MKSILKSGAQLAAFAGALGVLWSGTAIADDVHVYLAAGRFVQPINGDNIPMWGYMEYSPPETVAVGATPAAVTSPTACGGGQVQNNPALQVPGPEIVASHGDNVIVHLLNCVPNADNGVANGRTSLMIPGQAMPTVVDSNNGNNGADGPRYYTANQAANAGDAEFRGRMRSQVKETRRLNGNRQLPVTYTFSNVREGTFIYHSGTHMQVQVQMGLHGPLTVRPSGYNPTNGNADHKPYAGARTQYFDEYSIFYSEVDPDLHTAVDSSNYGPGKPVTSTVDYAPIYLLINGEPYNGAKLDLQAALGLPGANRVLLRVRNAGNRDHAIACKFCNGARAIAEDGHLYRFAADGNDIANDAGTVYERLQETFLAPPLQTRDLYITNVDLGGAFGRQLMVDVDRFGAIPPVVAAP